MSYYMERVRVVPLPWKRELKRGTSTTSTTNTTNTNTVLVHTVLVLVLLLVSFPFIPPR